MKRYDLPVDHMEMVEDPNGRYIAYESFVGFRNEVVVVDGTGFYVPEAVKAEVDRLQSATETLESALHRIIGLDHHNMGPESKATKLARAALASLGGGAA